jgi:hypothetical protein
LPKWRAAAQLAHADDGPVDAATPPSPGGLWYAPVEPAPWALFGVPSDLDPPGPTGRFPALLRSRLRRFAGWQGDQGDRFLPSSPLSLLLLPVVALLPCPIPVCRPGASASSFGDGSIRAHPGGPPGCPASMPPGCSGV